MVIYCIVLYGHIVWQNGYTENPFVFYLHDNLASMRNYSGIRDLQLYRYYSLVQYQFPSGGM